MPAGPHGQIVGTERLRNTSEEMPKSRKTDNLRTCGKCTVKAGRSALGLWGSYLRRRLDRTVPHTADSLR